MPESESGVCERVRSFGPRDWLFATALVAAVFLVYYPAWNGALIWDDDKHVTSQELRSWHGLFRIWFDLGATQQYYPLLHSLFWVQHKLWGDVTLGYHLVNILLHSTAAVMLALILLRLAIPGAWLAAAIFALHPVHVESVAWITELKNTLSIVFYLGAALAYLRFDRMRQEPGPRVQCACVREKKDEANSSLPSELRTLNPSPCYWAALGLFLMGLLSKTVAATLPGALLVIFWWQRGRLSWRRDVLPLLPFFLLGAAAGGFTAWVERTLIGAQGSAFEFTIIERCLIAGRAICFYLGKLFWPRELLFIYPRWDISQAAERQYLFPAAVLLLLTALWSVRQRWRGALAGVLFFVGTLFPVLGFFNVYPFVFSFVADHFQYLASLGIIALASAGVALLLERRRLWGRPTGMVLCLGLLTVLGSLTWRQSRMYGDIQTLYRTTIDRNPNSWMPHNNLGYLLLNRGQVDEAVTHFRKALEIKPEYVEAHNNLGNAFADKGRLDEAIAQYRTALRIDPDFAGTHNNLGLALIGAGKIGEAITHCQTALTLAPDFADAHNNLGLALAATGQFDEAIAHYQRALELKPDYAEAYNNLGNALLQRGHVDGAVSYYLKAIEKEPNLALAHNGLGVALFQKGRVNEAIIHFQKAVELKPGYVEARRNLDIARGNRL